MRKVSILMSVYNETENEVKKSIQSILEQSYTNIELVIVIDNPDKKDYYLQIINHFFNDVRIKVITNEQNMGLALSMNKAFENSVGEYIARMDADDIACQNRIEQEVRVLENDDYDFACTGYSYIDEDDNIIPGTYIFYNPQQLKDSLITTNSIHHPTVLMKRKIFEDANGYRDFPCSQDYDLWLRLRENGCKFVMIDEPLLMYRIRGNSTTSRKKFMQACTLYYISILFYQRICNGNDTYSKENYNSFIDNCNNKYRYHKENIDSIQKIQKKVGRGLFSDLIYRSILLLKSKFIRDSYHLKLKIRQKLKSLDFS